MSCYICKKDFSNVRGLHIHLSKAHNKSPIDTNKHKESIFSCQNCNQIFSRQYNLNRHKLSCDTLKKQSDSLQLMDELKNDKERQLNEVAELKNSIKEKDQQLIEKENEIKRLMKEFSDYKEETLKKNAQREKRIAARLNDTREKTNIMDNSINNSINNSNVTIINNNFNLESITNERILSIWKRYISSQQIQIQNEPRDQDSIQSTLNILVGHFLSELDNSIIKTDASRKTIMYIDGDNNNKEVRDPKGMTLSSKIRNAGANDEDCNKYFEEFIEDCRYTIKYLSENGHDYTSTKNILMQVLGIRENAKKSDKERFIKLFADDLTTNAPTIDTVKEQLKQKEVEHKKRSITQMRKEDTIIRPYKDALYNFFTTNIQYLLGNALNIGYRISNYIKDMLTAKHRFIWVNNELIIEDKEGNNIDYTYSTDEWIKVCKTIIIRVFGRGIIKIWNEDGSFTESFYMTCNRLLDFCMKENIYTIIEQDENALKNVIQLIAFCTDSIEMKEYNELFLQGLQFYKK